ncbi:MAG: class I SAM-dependent methyltransferase [Anaerolineae bacterium]|jgi:tRNA (uracil-5-)-methyltransferase TRM9
MDPAIAESLLELNRRFYDDFARQFSQSRTPDQPGWRRLLPFLPETGQLLDVGCGQARWAQFLASQGRRLAYVGVDSSEALLAIARTETTGLGLEVSLVAADIAAPHWQQQLPAGPFAAVVVLAVLHHIPGWQRRGALLAQLGSLLADDGILALSTWQFMNEARLRRKVTPWSAVGLASEQVEAGDYLLDWQRGGQGLRYCHLVDEAEMEALAQQAGLHMRALFYDDGRDKNLNLFAVLGKRPSAAT